METGSFSWIAKLPPTLSLCLVVKNEQRLLAQCLTNLRGAVDEIVVVDTGSTDRTVEIAERFGARIIRYRWDGSLGRARNAYLDAATGSWILVLDADEGIARKDFPQLRKLLSRRRVSAYFLQLRNYSNRFDLLENWYPNDCAYPKEERFSRCAGWSRGKILRLFRREPWLRYEEGTSVHTNPIRSLRERGAVLGECGIVIHHFQELKGGDAFVREKLRRRAQVEIKHTKLFPGVAWNYFNLGTTFLSLGEDRRALSYLSRALRLDARFERAHFAKGLVYQERGEYGRSVRSLESAIALKPDYADAWVVLGIVYDLWGKTALAQRALERAARLRPSHPLVHNSLGIVYAAQGKYRQAERSYRKAIRIHPRHPDAFFNLALLYKGQAKTEESLRLLRLASRVDPGDRQVRSLMRSLSKK